MIKYSRASSPEHVASNMLFCDTIKLGKNKQGIFSMDEESRVKIRKYNKNVEINGAAMIMFGAWSVIRIVLSFIMETDDVARYVDKTDMDMMTYLVIAILASLLVLIVVSIFHLSIGIGAIRYAKGKSKKKGFLFMSMLVMLGSVSTMPQYLSLLDSENNIDTTIASLMVDVTMIYIQIDMLKSVIRLEKLKKKAAVRG